MREPSDIEITYDGTDITDSVMFASARFEAQANAGIGTFSFVVKDTARTLSFTTGKEVILTLDGTPYYGGYLMQNGSRFAFPVVDSTQPVTARQHALQGVNFNVLFDRLVSHYPADHTVNIPDEAGDAKAGEILTVLADNYLDLPSGIDTTTFVDDVGRADPYATAYVFDTQGKTWREQMNRITLYNGAIYYIDASKNLHFHAPESVFSRWGFSDQPNRLAITSTPGYQGATYGFREMEASEDINDIVNDVFVWGGSPILATINDNDGTFFARRTNNASVTTYGRWQASEVRFGELGTQNAVNARAETIVPPDGSDLPPGVDPFDGVMRNRSKPNRSVRLSWFAHDVPELSGVREHLKPGDVVTITLFTFGDGEDPLTLILPLRRVTVSFPTLPSDTGGEPKTFVRFDGEFGLSLSDPYNLWEAILNKQTRIERLVNSVGTPDAVGAPGALWQGAPDETPNSSITTFTLSSLGAEIAYVAGSSNVYVEGVRQMLTIDYTENPTNGTITFVNPPSTGASMWVIVRLAG